MSVNQISVEAVNAEIRRRAQKWGAIGGKVKSEKKRLAVLKNLEKANAVRLSTQKSLSEDKEV